MGVLRGLSRGALLRVRGQSDGLGAPSGWLRLRTAAYLFGRLGDLLIDSNFLLCVAWVCCRTDSLSGLIPPPILFAPFGGMVPAQAQFFVMFGDIFLPQ